MGENALASAYDELLRCNKCGFCQAACPVYRITGREGSTARGHNAIARAMLEGRLELGPDIARDLTECLLCRACFANCFSAVKTDEVVLKARADYSAHFGLPKVQKILFHKVLADPSVGRLYLKPLFASRGSAFLKGLRKAGIFKYFLPRFDSAMELIGEPKGDFLLDALMGRRFEPHSKARLKVAYFVGCGLNYVLPRVGLATLRGMVRAGIEVEVAENGCCGLPAFVHGDLWAARSSAKRNLEVFKDLKVERIVTDCASCYSFLKSYGSLVGTEEAGQFALRVEEFSRLMLDLKPAALGDLKFNARVTYHDPCHGSRYEDLRSQPREILKMVPGVDFVEMPEADWCCGGAGSYAVEHMALSRQILKRKIAKAGMAQADVIATSCPACIMQLSYGAKAHGLKAEVLHLSEVLDRAFVRGSAELDAEV